MNEKIELLSAMFSKYGKLTFYKVIHEKKQCIIFILTSKENFNNIIIERGSHIHESYHKKERILKIYGPKTTKVYSFSVLNLLRNKLRLNGVSLDV